MGCQYHFLTLFLSLSHTFFRLTDHSSTQSTITFLKGSIYYLAFGRGALWDWMELA